MTESTSPQPARPDTTTAQPLIVDDVLLVLFQPSTGAILGEDVLYYVLGGAVLADLSIGGWIARGDASKWGGNPVRATSEKGPDADVLRIAWDKIAAEPRDVQTVLAESGPLLREPVIDRLVASGDLHAETKKTLGLFTSTSLSEGDTGRRAELIAGLRAVLIDGVEPTPRMAALVALLSASGELWNLNSEIPWGTKVAERAFALQYGTVEGSATGQAVMRTDIAAYITPLVVGLFAR
jgi:hypothetical protein